MSKNKKPVSSEIAISVQDVHKSFKLPTERAWGLKQAIFNRLKGVKGFKEQKVLRGISFDVHQGEFLGIVGRNGSSSPLKPLWSLSIAFSTSML